MHFILTPCARAVMCAGVVAIVASCFSVVSAAAACGGMPTVVIGQPVYCTTPGEFRTILADNDHNHNHNDHAD